MERHDRDSSTEGKDGGSSDPRACATSLTLLQRIRSNDQNAWQRLVQLYSPLVYYWCQKWGCRPENQDDTVQEVFLAVSSALGKFRRDRPGDTFRGWLRGITRNTLLMSFRRAAHQPQPAGGTDAWMQLQEIADSNVDDDEEPPVEVQALHQRALELVRREFEAKTWQMFWLAVVEGRPPVEIAAELGLSPAAVRMAKCRVLRRLKEELIEE